MRRNPCPTCFMFLTNRLTASVRALLSPTGPMPGQQLGLPRRTVRAKAVDGLQAQGIKSVLPTGTSGPSTMVPARPSAVAGACPKAGPAPAPAVTSVDLRRADDGPSRVRRPADAERPARIDPCDLSIRVRMAAR